MTLIVAILSAILATITTRLYMRKQIHQLHRDFENQLTTTYYKRYEQGRSEGFQEGRNAAKIAEIRMFN